MLRIVIATALALCVSTAIGCAKKGAAPGAAAKPSGGTASQSTTAAAPVDYSKANVEAKIPLPPPLFESAEIGKSAKPDGSIAEKTDDFAKSDHLIISVKSAQVPKGLAANLTIKNPEKKPVVDTRAEFDAATKRAVFSVPDLSKWKPGLYDIEVMMEGDVVYKHGMRVGGPPAKSKKR